MSPAETLELIRDLVRRRFVLFDEETQIVTPHPRFDGVSRADVQKAVREDYELNPSGIMH